VEDVQFMAVAEDLARYVEEKLGRRAAWAIAASMALLPLAIVATVIW
jgi:hypothetical protein